MVWDPILVHASAAILSVILITGGLSKLRHFDLFEAAVAAYRLLPMALLRPFALGFVAAELAAGLLVLLPQWRLLGGMLALAVLLVATMGIAINLLRGHTDVDCGCAGLGRSSSGGLSWWLVSRNTLLALLAVPLLASTSVATRHLGWFDGALFFAMVLAVLGLYFSSTELIDAHARLQKMQGETQ